ncbi:MAG: hypothetical protein KAR21_25785 [Spirochaetales bacterium]|nr:hypothetical protein [Spirochaetales bacterium]
MRSDYCRKITSVGIWLFFFFFCITIQSFAGTFLSLPESYQMTGGASMELFIDEDSSALNFSPVFTFFMGRITTGNFPVEEAGFMSQTGFVSLKTQIFTGLKQRNIDESINSLEDTTVGYDLNLHWIWDKIPLTITFPYTEKRIRWKDVNNDDETRAILHYHTMVGELGYYITPYTEISAGLGYLQPDLFYKETSGTSIYSYLAWDIKILTLRGKTVLDLPGMKWLSLESSFSLISDQENNKLTGGSFLLTYYPLQTLGISILGSASSFTGGDNYWNDLLEVMGASNFGIEVTTGLLPWLDLQGGFSRIIPNKEEYNPVSVISLSVLIRA